VNIEVKYLPYAMLFLTLIMGGPQVMWGEFIGILAAHLYDFLTVYWPRYGGGFNLISTPEFVNRWFVGMSGAKQVEVKGHGVSYKTSVPMSGSSAFSSGSSWNSRGAGRRLG
jgi:Derlin-2/3